MGAKGGPIRGSATLYLAAFGALLGALSTGLALGYTAPAFLDMERQSVASAANNGSNLSSTLLDANSTKSEGQKSLIGSALAIGAFAGSLLCGPFNNYFGRRNSIAFFGLPQTLGWLLIGTGNNVATLIVGRLLIGLCCGLSSGLAPTYVNEISTPKLRALLGTCFQLMIVLGLLLAATLGALVSWRVLAYASTLPTILMISIMIFMPETPQWLLSKSRKDEAKESLDRLRSGPVAREFGSITQSCATSEQVDSTLCFSFAVLMSKEFYKPLVYAMALMFFQQFSGINAVVFYETDIFKKASPQADASQSTILVCLAQVIATILGSFIIDYFGRRTLLVASGAGVALAMFLFGLHSYLSQANKDFQIQYGWAALGCLILFIAFFSLGYGSIPWMMIPEFTTPRVRSLVASIATAFNWACLYAVTAAVKDFMEIFGDSATYWLFASSCMLSCTFNFFLLPETRNRSAEEIQRDISESIWLPVVTATATAESMSITPTVYKAEETGPPKEVDIVN